MLLALLLAVSSATASAQILSGKEVVEAAAQAMGGRSHILAAHSLVAEGMGSNPNVLEQMRPEDPPLVWALPEYREAIDLDHARFQEKLVRRPAFSAVFDNAPQDARLDGDVAYNGGASPQRLPAAVAEERRVQMLHHPLALLRAALASGSRLGPARKQGEVDEVEIVTAAGDRLTLAVDRVTALPKWIRSMSEHPMLGDVATVSRFDGYALEEPSGLILPRHVVTTLDGTVEYDLQLISNQVNADVSDLAAPAIVSATAAPAVPVETIHASELAPGVFFLTGARPGWNSVLVEFADHLTLIEAPLSEARAEALFAEARTLRPGKPLTELIVSHFHVDHASGFRAAVAAGLTVITQQGNEAFLRDIARRPFTIRPDVLARHPRALKLRSFDDRLVLKDATRELVLYHVRHSTHCDTLLMAYLPKERMLINADSFYDPAGKIMPHTVLFEHEVQARGLQVQLNVPLHGAAPTDEATYRTIEQQLESGERR
jgi:hypothetical protein